MLSNMTPFSQLRKAWQVAALPSLVMESLSFISYILSLYGIDRGVASRIALASLYSLSKYFIEIL